MLLLTGEYHVNFDSRSRVNLPRGFIKELHRNELWSDELVLIPYLENGVVCIIPQEEYHNFIDRRLKDAPGKNEDSPFSYLEYITPIKKTLDEQRRIHIPTQLQHFARLGRPVTAIGVRDHIELWNVEHWEQYLEKHFKKSEQLLPGQRKDLEYTPDQKSHIWLPSSKLVTLPEWSTFINQVSANSNLLYQLDWKKFEDFVAHLLKDFGWLIEPMGYTKDGGIDLIAVRSVAPDIDTRMMVQCKKYAKNRKVGIDIVRELWAVKWNKGFHHAMIATTSSFTREATRQAKEWNLDLRDHDRMIEWCRQYAKSSHRHKTHKEHTLE